MRLQFSNLDDLFQSTLSVRRATRRTGRVHGNLRISIHALRKESDEYDPEKDTIDTISIHALRKESDSLALKLFPEILISIHALRKESDSCRPPSRRSARNFNPRSP